jgi:hypothetical protein
MRRKLGAKSAEHSPQLNGGLRWLGPSASFEVRVSGDESAVTGKTDVAASRDTITIGTGHQKGVEGSLRTMVKAQDVEEVVSLFSYAMEDKQCTSCLVKEKTYQQLKSKRQELIVIKK